MILNSIKYLLLPFYNPRFFIYPISKKDSPIENNEFNPLFHIHRSLNMKKRSNLLQTIGALLLIGFVLTSLISFYVSRKSLRAEIETNTLPLTGDNIYTEIQRDLLRPIFISSLMASDTFLRDWVLMGEEGSKNITKYLKEIQKRYNTITAFFISDATRIYYHADGVLKKVKEDEPRDEWYFRVRKMTDEYEINVDHDMANLDAMTVFVNYRVYDYAGSYIGVTGVGLTVNAVKQLIEDYQNKYSRRIFFVAENGDVALAGSTFPNSLKNIFQIKNFPSFTKNAGGEDQYYRYTDNDQVIHTNIRYIPEFDWYLIVEQPETQATRKLLGTFITNLAICLIITIVVIFLVNITIKADRNKIATLQGIVPICSYCKQIRDDKGYWNQVEAYVSRHTEAKFSHGICPNCLQENFPEMNRK